MTVELIGKVVKIGRVKDYGVQPSWGKYIPDYKFYMQIDTKDEGIVNVMVQCKGEQTDYGFRIPKDADRQKPYVGDEVVITTHTLKKNGGKWASVTWNQSIEITEVCIKARKERDEWIAKKKAERQAEYKQKIEDAKQSRIDAELERLGHLETQKYDERLPEDVRSKISKTFDIELIIKLLRDTSWFVTPEGEGGKQAVYNMVTGYVMEDGYPGTGMRRPGGCLHGHPDSVRKSILNKAIESNLIINTNNGYKSTEKGLKLLLKLDKCNECQEIRRPVNAVSVVVYERSSKRYHLGIRYMCSCEIEKERPRSGCNTGLIITELKSTPKKLEKIMECV